MVRKAINTEIFEVLQTLQHNETWEERSSFLVIEAQSNDIPIKVHQRTPPPQYISTVSGGEEGEEQRTEEGTAALGVEHRSTGAGQAVDAIDYAISAPHQEQHRRLRAVAGED